MELVHFEMELVHFAKSDIYVITLYMCLLYMQMDFESEPVLKWN